MNYLKCGSDGNEYINLKMSYHLFAMFELIGGKIRTETTYNIKMEKGKYNKPIKFI